MESIVTILEDDAVMGKLLQDQVNSIDGYRCNTIFENPNLFLESDHCPDIMLLDITMPKMNGLDAIEPILKKCPDVAIVINTIRDDDETIMEALKKGAVGYLDKQYADLKLGDVLATISNGGGYMTPKIARRVFDSFRVKKGTNLSELSPGENQVVKGILDGLSYKMIGEKNNMSINTVRMHVKRIYRKLNINSKGELFNLTKI